MTQPRPPGQPRPITVGICTRDRHASLLRCLRSLRHAEGLIEGVLVADDAPEHPVEPVLRAELGDDAPPGLAVLASAQRTGPSAARNRIARQARTPFILYLDDDAALLPGGAVADALAVLRGDPSVAAVAFAQADEAGTPYPPGAQPSPATEPALVRTFIGFAHLVRAEAVRAVGGYREILDQNGEERELTLRLLDAGYRVVYLPGAAVAHLADGGGRDAKRFLFLTVRNDALYGLLNEPLPMALGLLVPRLLRYFPMRRHWGGEDPGGFRRVVRAVADAAPRVRAERRAVRWSTLRTWLALKASPPYRGPGEP
ncbi:MAG TPA: glycosyltransferase [Longimicrobium sp.]